MRRVIMIVGFLLVSIGFLGGLVVADAGNTDKNVIDQLIQQTKKSIQVKKRKEQTVLGSLLKQQQELSKLEQNYGQIKNQLTKTEDNLQTAKWELSKLQNQLYKSETDLKKRQELLNQRLVVIYKHGFQSYLELLLAAGNYGDLINRFETLSYFIKDDLSLIGAIQAAKLELKTQSTNVETKKQQVEHQFIKIAALQDQVSTAERQVKVKVGQTKQELAKVQQDRAALEKALEEYEQTSREIERTIRKDEQKGPGDVLGSGHMTWPVHGRLSSGFGWRYHPVLHSKKYHNGQDIAVPSGTPVLAADSGVILVSGWEGGYGNFVAIDHGNGISTCYGHNSRLLVKVGEKVVKGQTIAISGSTGLSTGPHVHFEVRRNGVPIDPLPYLP